MVLFPKRPQVTPSPIQSILQVRNWVGNTLQNHTEDSRGVQGPLLRTVGISTDLVLETSPSPPWRWHTCYKW